MVEILLAIVIALQIFLVLLNMALYSRVTAHDAERRLDEKVQEAQEEEARRSRDMDQGFDNLMRFSVRGHDGFGGGDE